MVVACLIAPFVVRAQGDYKTEVVFLDGEYWWGGVVAYGAQMPYVGNVKLYDLATQNNNNQVVPLFVSSKGRYLWSDKPFRFEISDRRLTLFSDYEDIEVVEAGRSLRDAYLAANEKHFPPSGEIPQELFFSMPQYNTWIELMYDQTQERILEYARGIIDNGFPPGVLMIDDNWQKYYGNFEFKPDRFPDPKGMIDKLHSMGFKVMAWVCPFVSADSPEYRDLAAKRYLVTRRNSGYPATIGWWNGQSACYDLTNPAAAKHLVKQLREVQNKYGIDGFKFDAGDNSFYDTRYVGSYKKDAVSVDHTMAWAEVGLKFPYNEYRACWRMGGQPLVQRLGDKNYSWSAVRSLIPEMIAAGLLGYAYTCPDMIGGGQVSDFRNADRSKLDQHLIVRSAQIHALMPMMQFSVAPWKVLNSENLELVRQAARLHEKLGPYIVECAGHSARTGEPIVRHMAYSFPDEGFETCRTQFMLGERYLMAPVVDNLAGREVKLPKGKWRDDCGVIHKGGKVVKLDAPLGRIVYFERAGK